MASIFEIPEELFSRHCVVWDVSPPRFFQRLFIRATWCSSTGGATSRTCDFHASREVRHRSLKGALHVTIFVIRISGTNFRHTVVEFWPKRDKQRRNAIKKMRTCSCFYGCRSEGNPKRFPAPCAGGAMLIWPTDTKNDNDWSKMNPWMAEAIGIV